VGDFSKVAVWQPAINESNIETGSENSVGSVRICSLDGGGQLKEKLIEHDNKNMMFHFDFLQTPMPMSNAAATIQLHSVTESAETYFEWRMSFEPDEGVENGLVEMIAAMILAGFDSLHTRFVRQ